MINTHAGTDRRTDMNWRLFYCKLSKMKLIVL